MMSDQPPSQPRPRRRPPAKPSSRESRFIGYLVLGFGTLAVIAMLMIAFGGGDETAQTQEQASLQKELSSIEAPARASEEPEEDKLYLKRQKKIDEGDIQGGWQSMIGEYLAVLQIQKGSFQIIMALPDPQMPRKYFSGTYNILDDLIVLNPQLKWGEPKKPAGAKFSYSRLTSSGFPMVVGFENGNMVWQNTPQTEKRMYVPSRSPLLSLGGMDYIIWKKAD